MYRKGLGKGHKMSLPEGVTQNLHPRGYNRERKEGSTDDLSFRKGIEGGTVNVRRREGVLRNGPEGRKLEKNATYEKTPLSEQTERLITVKKSEPRRDRVRYSRGGGPSKETSVHGNLRV